MPSDLSRADRNVLERERMQNQAEALVLARERTLGLIDGLDDRELSKVVDPILSPLAWDLGHIANFEQRWLLGPDDDSLDSVYDPFAQPRAIRGGLPLLQGDQCFTYMEEVRSRVLEQQAELDPFLTELVIQHELQHSETMLQLLAQHDAGRPDAVRDRRSSGPAEWRTMPEGVHAIGREPTHPGDFVYDNERAAHARKIDAFEIATTPVTVGEYSAWIEAGGYQRPEWWSEEGLAWLDEARVRAPLGWRATDNGHVDATFGEVRELDPDSPVCHVSWFEADAYARAHDARLPDEFEWEAAARAGVIDEVGEVWEWTASEFDGYGGFEPFCYAEYSEPFFAKGYRVLRGGSSMSHPRTYDDCFRNWDFPQRRQIFSGIRLARSS